MPLLARRVELVRREASRFRQQRANERVAIDESEEFIDAVRDELEAPAQNVDDPDVPGAIERGGDVASLVIPGLLLGGLAGAMAERGLRRGREFGAQYAPRRVESAARDIASRATLGAKATEWARAHAARLVTEVTEGTRDAIRRVVTEGLRRGAHTGAVKKDLKQLVGLHSRQALAAMRFRAGLETKGLAGDLVDRRVERYARKLRDQRAETIARTEMFTAIGQGRVELWNELEDEGEISKAEFKRSWMTAHDERVDDICQELEDYGSVGMDEPFIGSEGEFFSEIAHIGCRCIVVVEEV